MTIDTDVAVELDVAAMKAGEPDVEALRALFAELEFTSLLKELLPVVEVKEGDYREIKSKAEFENTWKAWAKTRRSRLRLPPSSATKSSRRKKKSRSRHSLDFWRCSRAACEPSAQCRSRKAHRRFECAGSRSDRFAGRQAARRSCEEPCSKIPLVPKTFTISSPLFIISRNCRHSLSPECSTIPCSIPTCSIPRTPRIRLAEVALRRFNLKLSGNLAEAADVTGRLATALRKEVDDQGLTSVYDEIDAPLVPVLARMEDAGVKIDLAALEQMSGKLQREAAAKARDIYERCGVEFNINSPKQLGDVLFNKLALPMPVKYGKGKKISTAVDVLEGLAAEHEVPRLVLEYRQLTKLKSTYVDALPALIRSQSGRVHTTFGQTGTATGRLSSANPNLQNIPDSHRTRARDSRGLHCRAGTCAAGGGLFADRVAAARAFFERQIAGRGLPPRRRHSHPDRIAGVRRASADGDARPPPRGEGGELRHRLWPVGLRSCRSNWASEPARSASKFIDAYFEKYAGVRAFIDATLEQARREQKVTTLFGRVRPIPDINSKNANQRGFAERTAVNTPLQGTAADLIKLAMIRIDEEIRAAWPEVADDLAGAR